VTPPIFGATTASCAPAFSTASRSASLLPATVYRPKDGDMIIRDKGKGSPFTLARRFNKP
jgi:hypothetical protein